MNDKSRKGEKFTSQEINLVKSMIRRGYSNREIANDINVSRTPGAIKNLRYRLAFQEREKQAGAESDADKPEQVSEIKSKLAIGKHRYKRFTDAEIEAIRAWASAGETDVQIGERLGRSGPSIRSLCTRRGIYVRQSPAQDVVKEQPEQVSDDVTSRTEVQGVNDIKKSEQVFVDAEFFEHKPMKEVNRRPTLEEFGMIALLWSGVCLVITVVYKVAVLL